MKRSIYEAVIATIDRQNVWDFAGCLNVLLSNFPDENPETLRSIVSQRYQKRVKTTFQLFTNPQKQEEVFADYQRRRKRSEGPGIIVEMARRMNFSPILTARIVVEQWLNQQSPNKANKSQVTKYLKNSAQIFDPVLSFEVYQAGLADDLYGTSAEAIKHSIGLEHEQILKQKLDSLNIAYQDENHFRKMGYDKTPDIKLEAPFAVGGSIVNWIESKALFGDEESHATYLRDQLWSYWNRFGPGLVIYWFGFIEEIQNVKKHSGILVCDSFPKNIILYNPSYGVEEMYERLNKPENVDITAMHAAQQDSDQERDLGEFEINETEVERGQRT